jgi:predicted TIM-barrel fold metal-dependent hydrolase
MISGFGKRLMYGSDQMYWPSAIERSIEAVDSASFLSDQDKQDIFYNNAARFLRLSGEEIEKHHATVSR